MPTSAEPPLTPLNELRARLKPGALHFSLADPAEARAWRAEAPIEGLAWLGWGQRERLLREERPSAQERYSSQGGRHGLSLGAWLAPAYERWREGAGGVHHRHLDLFHLERNVQLCQLEGLVERPVSLLSNGEAARACLARALGGRPRLLVLDDFCEGLDAPGREGLWAALRELAAEGLAIAFLASRPKLFPWAIPAWAPLEEAEPGPGPIIFRSRGLDLSAGELTLLRDLDWEIRGGEAWWVQGLNGAGKSSLLAYLSGEHPQAWAQDWELLGAGRPAWTPLAKLRDAVAWVSPELAAAARRPLHVLLDEALRSDAALLLLDEPMRGLHEHEAAAWRARLSLALSTGKQALVFVSHDPDEAPPGHSHTLRLLGGGRWESA
jgi:ABC-type molybdenum transport system ATPase subunit/photorepair protein PhrA